MTSCVPKENRKQKPVRGTTFILAAFTANFAPSQRRFQLGWYYLIVDKGAWGGHHLIAVGAWSVPPHPMDATWYQ